MGGIKSFWGQKMRKQKKWKKTLSCKSSNKQTQSRGRKKQVDYDDSQDKLPSQIGSEPESQDSFSERVAELIGAAKDLKKKKGGNAETNVEPRRCSRLKDQEDVDRTELAMKRTAKKNEVSGISETSNQCSV